MLETALVGRFVLKSGKIQNLQKVRERKKTKKTKKEREKMKDRVWKEKNEKSAYRFFINFLFLF